VIVAIDGPAGSGKSTTARRVAERLGWLYLDTGAMYRAAALAFLDAGRPFSEDAAEEIVPDLRIDIRRADGGLQVFLGERDVTQQIRTPDAGKAASHVSALPKVRARLLEEQRRIASGRADDGGVVLEGRDIGTVVFPDAEVKIYLVARPEERARRRHAELAKSGSAPSIESVTRELSERDERDRGRAIAPLRKADDAVELDTTDLTPAQQVDRVIALIEARRRELAGE